MLRPPFTVLILKNSRQPVTIRVTTVMILAVVGVTALVGALCGFGISYTVFSMLDHGNTVTVSDNTGNIKAVEHNSLGSSNSPGIESITFRKSNKDITGITFSLSSPQSMGNLYIWVIINPNANTPGEQIIIPRTPLFRGLPVDYRNGTSFRSEDNKDISIQFGEDASGITVNTLRILVYTQEGNLVVDRLFQENSPERM